MNNDKLISNYVCIGKRLKQLADNYIYLVLDAFHYVQTTFKAILSKYDSNKSFKSASRPSSEYRILTRKAFNRDKVHFTEITSSFQATEKIHFTESDNRNETRNSIIERSISLEMNKTEFRSVNGE